jgi:hypothetical protein
VYNYGTTYGNILTFIAATDETMAREGYRVGASVGTSSANIEIYKDTHVSARILYDGSAWEIQLPFNVSSVEWVSVGGYLEITHDAISGRFEPAVFSKNPALVPFVTTLGSTITRVEFYNWSGTKVTTLSTNMDIWFKRTAPLVFIDPEAHAMPEFHNIWCIGVFELA